MCSAVSFLASIACVSLMSNVIAMPFGGRECAFNGLVESVIMFKLMDFHTVL